MKTIILLIALVLCNLSFGCVILPNGNYIPCETNITEIIVKKSFKQKLGSTVYDLSYIAYDKALIEKIENAKTNIENVKTNIEYNVKLAESRLNEAEVKYVESIKKYKTTLHNAASKSFIKQKVYSDIAKQNAYSEMIIAKQNAYSEMFMAEQKAYYEMSMAEQKAHYEMRMAEYEYDKARWECGWIYAIAKGESTYLPVGKSPSEIFKSVK